MRLATQTRVYHQDPDTGDWQAGRIVGGEPPTYFVRFPNSESDRAVAEKNLRVRWDRPVADPLDVLVHGANESPHFRDARSPLLATLIEQRAACASASALLSSAVEIYPHQVRAALAVLSDPVQRYLLADEVGLGKTIEAGYVIRQTLLDNPHSSIAIIAPDMLRRQWREELVNKFFIDDFPDAVIKIGSHDDTAKWLTYEDFDLVVVDEAHHLVRGELPDDPKYVALAGLAHSVEKLLLLSATPVLQRETTQLGLLHLLDPALYPWSELAAFRARLVARRQLATALFALSVDFEYLLPEVLEDVRRCLPADPGFERAAAKVMALLDDEGNLRRPMDRPALAEAVEAVRAHVGETYRLHRRVIRQRRAHILGAHEQADAVPFEVRGRRNPEPLTSSDHVDRVEDAVTDWLWKTQPLLAHHQDNPSVLTRESFGGVLAVVASRMGGYVDDLLDLMSFRVHQDVSAAMRAGLSDAEQRVLEAVPTTRADAELLGRLQELAVRPSPSELEDSLVPAMQMCSRLVIFCGPGSLAASLAAALRERFPKAPIYEHTAEASSAESEKAVHAWRLRGGVLVADATADDGRNFQMADGVVHCRLPASPNVLEQRIGRVDRYGSEAAARQFTLASSENMESLTGAWLALLVEGFGIFTQSVSALQDAIDGRLTSVWAAAADLGPQGLRQTATALQEELAEQRREIDRLDNLESSFEATDGRRDIAREISALETDWRRIERATLGFVGERSEGGLRLGVRDMGDGSVRIERGRHAPLIEPRLLRRMVAIPAHSRVGAFNRSRALRSEGMRLLRLGHPVIDLLSDVLAIDDRGQASAHWRADRRHAGEPVVYFGFDYLVEADLQPTLRLLESNSDVVPSYLRREADRNFPPFLRRVWLDSDKAKAVDDATLINWLDAPYDNSTADRNLGGQRQTTLFSLFGDRESFSQAARDAQHAAVDELHRVSDLDEQTRKAAERLKSFLAVLQAQSSARRQAGGLTDDASVGLFDGEVGHALAAGIANPTCRLVAVTCIVRSTRGWSTHDL